MKAQSDVASRDGAFLTLNLPPSILPAVIAALFFVLATLLRAQAAAGSDLSERIEAGRSKLINGTEVAYRIRLLPLASFPSLPAAFAQQLQQRGCMVPQTYEARQPENVIHGSFEKKGSEDWAVLCSVDGTTTLYICLASRPGEMIALRHQSDAAWLGSESVGHYGSAWGISARMPSQISPSKLRGATPDHAGIEDAFIEHGSTVHYFKDGEWSTLEAGN